MGVWTLQYSATGFGGSTVEQQVNNLGWGLGQGKLKRRSLVPSVLSFTAEGQAIDSTPKFVYKSYVIVWQNRTVTNGAFSGGTIYFQGVTTGINPVGTPGSESVVYEFSDVLWYLAKMVYEQEIYTGDFTSHVLLNVDPLNPSGLNITMQQQVQNILDYALTLVPDVLQYDVSGLPVLYLPSDEKKDIPCLEAVKNELRWAPSGTSWVDYTQTPPKVYFLDRLSMSSMSVVVGTGVIVSGNIKPLYDLQVPQVIIRYEQTDTVGESEEFVIYTDQYPAGAPGTPIGVMRATINLQGFKGKEQSAVLATQLFDPTQLSWWQQKHPWLSACSNVQFSNPGYTDNSGNPVTPLTYEVLNDGAVHPWMLQESVFIGQQDTNVTASVSYTDPAGNIVQDEEINCRIKTTNGTTGTYTSLSYTQYAENPPVGMAQYFYSVLSILQYEGEVEIMGAEVGTVQYLGKLLNVTGTANSAWATMNALVTEVDEDLDAGKVTVKFGANKYLSPGELMDLLKVTRTRTWSYYPNAAIYGGAQEQQVQMLSASARENSVRGNRTDNVKVVSYTNAAGIVTTTTLDSINQVLTIATSDPTQPQVQIALSDLSP